MKSILADKKMKRADKSFIYAHDVSDATKKLYDILVNNSPNQKVPESIRMAYYNGHQYGGIKMTYDVVSFDSSFNQISLEEGLKTHLNNGFSFGTSLAFPFNEERDREPLEIEVTSNGVKSLYELTHLQEIDTFAANFKMFFAFLGRLYAGFKEDDKMNIKYRNIFENIGHGVDAKQEGKKYMKLTKLVQK